MKYEDENAYPSVAEKSHEIATYIIQRNGGDAVAAVETLLDEIEHLQMQLSIAVAAMGRGYTRGWVPNAEREHG